MELFFYPELDENQKLVKLTGEEFHHLSKVLRIKLNDEIFLTNGRGLIAKALISKVSRQDCETEILEFQKFERKKIKLTALIPILKQEERFEFAIEKLTELGIDEIQPFYSERTIKKKFRFERSKKILITALKQSFNPFLPELKESISFEEFISELRSDEIIFYGDKDGHKFLAVQDFLIKSNLTRIILTVGPEGAFSDKELNFLRRKNSIAIWLGEYRLRSETAIISLASQLKLFVC